VRLISHRKYDSSEKEGFNNLNAGLILTLKYSTCACARRTFFNIPIEEEGVA